jgi:molybdopterin-guanine dinucleotide biosynthesis protein MobB
MGLLASRLLDIELPQSDKSLYTIAECDGCGTGGIEIATGCTIDHRTLHILDYGKLAATFIHTKTGQAVRIVPKPGCRELAEQYYPGSANSWESQLAAYQIMPDEDLLSAQMVQLTISLKKLISRPGLRVNCEICGEEISNEREITRQGAILCQSCAGASYYQNLNAPTGAEQRGGSTSSQDHPKRSSTIHPPVITIIGKSGSGKTTLLEKLIRELTERGYRLGTVKHHSHSGFEIDVPGKDSWRFAQAGSKHVVISAPDKIATYALLDQEIDLDRITQGITEVDLILVEGYKNANKPTIEVIRSEIYKETMSDPQHCLAIVSDMQINIPIPLFDPNDIPGISELIVQWISQPT